MDDNIFYSTMLSFEAYMRKYIIDPLDYIDHFIFVSRFAMDKHIEFNKGFEPRSSHLYNFTGFTNEKIIDGSGHAFLYYGRLSKEKGLGTLLTAAARLKLDLTIAGTGPLQDLVTDYASGNSNIRYVGFKSGNELIELVSNSSFIIVPSEWYENNPMTVIEAYALGKPVIGSRIGGIPEIVKDPDTGFLFEPGNPDDLIRVISRASAVNSEDYLKMAENARNIASEKFSSESHYNKLLSIYESLAGR